MRLYILIFSLLLLISCNNDSSENDIPNSSWQDVIQNGSGTITLAYVPSAGFSYEDEEGNLTGVTIELIHDFSDYINTEYEIELDIYHRPIEHFAEFYHFVQTSQGGVFGVANVTITEERRSELAFSPPYMTNIAVLITHSDVPEIGHYEEIETVFEGLHALAFEGTLHQDRLQGILNHFYPDADMLFAHSNNEIIERTASENRYFAYVDIYNYWRAAEQGEPVRRHEAGDESAERFGVIMPLKSDWHPLMEEFFLADGGYIHSERYRELMERHLGQELADLLLEQTQ
jgi:hypothetical protein